MPLPNTRAPVLLLRAPNGSPDPYEAALTESGYRPFSVPVLETVLVNGEELKGILRDGPGGGDLKDGLSGGNLEDGLSGGDLKDGPSGGNGDEEGDEEREREGGYGGVIVTSSRAAEAWGKAVEEIANEVGSESEIAACKFFPPYPYITTRKHDVLMFCSLRSTFCVLCPTFCVLCSMFCVLCANSSSPLMGHNPLLRRRPLHSLRPLLHLLLSPLPHTHRPSLSHRYPGCLRIRHSRETSAFHTA